MSENENYEVQPYASNPTYQSKVKEHLGKVSLVAASVFLPAMANAAEITAIGEGLSGEIDATKAIVLTLFGAGAILLGIFAGYRYLKRGANSA